MNIIQLILVSIVIKLAHCDELNNDHTETSIHDLNLTEGTRDVVRYLRDASDAKTAVDEAKDAALTGRPWVVGVVRSGFDEHPDVDALEAELFWLSEDVKKMTPRMMLAKVAPAAWVGKGDGDGTDDGEDATGSGTEPDGRGPSAGDLALDEERLLVEARCGVEPGSPDDDEDDEHKEEAAAPEEDAYWACVDDVHTERGSQPSPAYDLFAIDSLGVAHRIDVLSELDGEVVEGQVRDALRALGVKVLDLKSIMAGREDGVAEADGDEDLLDDEELTRALAADDDEGGLDDDDQDDDGEDVEDEDDAEL